MSYKQNACIFMKMDNLPERNCVKPLHQNLMFNDGVLQVPRHCSADLFAVVLWKEHFV